MRAFVTGRVARSINLSGRVPGAPYLPGFGGWPTQAWFWLEWGSSRSVSPAEIPHEQNRLVWVAIHAVADESWLPPPSYIDKRWNAE